MSGRSTISRWQTSCQTTYSSTRSVEDAIAHAARHQREGHRVPEDASKYAMVLVRFTRAVIRPEAIQCGSTTPVF